MHPAEPLTAPRLSLRGLRAYLAERFPVPVTFALALAVGASSYAVAQAALVRAGAPLLLDGLALGGVLMVFLFLLHLRVFDEHKDFAIDSETRPDRPVQRGLVTLGQLKVVGAAAIAAELALAFGAGWKSGLLFLVPLGYSVLMYFEFFAPRWLGARLHLYALSHTVVMCLLTGALALRFEIPAGLALPVELWALGALNLTAFLSVDVLRKTWAPGSEVEGLDSYSSRLGVPRACAVGAILLLASAAIAGWIGWRLGGGAPWLAVVGLVTGWGLAELHRFARTPTARGEKRLEAAAGAGALVLLLGLAVVAGLQQGVVLSRGGETWALLR